MTLDSVARFLLVALVAYSALGLAARLLAGPMMFFPPPSSYGPDLVTARVPVGESDSIAVVHLPNDTARFTILFSHGNAEDIGYALPFLKMLRDAGFAVLAYDYRGYGLSSGRPTPGGVVEDLEAAFDFAAAELGIPADRLVLHGRSLGSGPTMALAAERAPAGVILESGFIGAYPVMTRFRVIPFDPFPNLRHVRAFGGPVLVIHGERDEVIGAWHGRRMYEAAPNPAPPLWVEEAGHNDLVMRAGDRYVEALRGFRAALGDRP
jgi:fermentation-respiration switch protein FrsA (DUF1100 family)